LIFDLDPDPALPWKRVKAAAETLRGRLSALGFIPFVKTTGRKGLHVVVPVTPGYGWDTVKSLTKDIAADLAHQAPDLYTATMSKAKRRGKIYLDYLRNARSATAVSAYSTRAREHAPVSVPVDWDELSSDVRENHFTIHNVPRRLARLRRDPWEGYEASWRNIPEKLVKAQQDKH
jgi:bifunctional non-homologous end joining protein LigD